MLGPETLRRLGQPLSPVGLPKMPDDNRTVTPFDLALQLAEDALLAQLDASERELRDDGRLAGGRWAAVRADFDTYRQLVADRDRWRLTKGAS